MYKLRFCDGFCQFSKKSPTISFLLLLPVNKPACPNEQNRLKNSSASQTEKEKDLCSKIKKNIQIK